MKTFYDLERMKVQPCFPFGSAYSYFISRLADYYISKSNGIERIKYELQKWDAPTKAYIIDLVVDEINNTGIMFFDEDELRSEGI